MRVIVGMGGRVVALALAAPLVVAPASVAGGKRHCESMSKGGTNKLEVCMEVRWQDSDAWAISHLSFTHQVIGGDNKADGSKLVFTPILTLNGGKSIPPVTRTFSSRTGYVNYRERDYTYNCTQYAEGRLFDFSQNWTNVCHNFNGDGKITTKVQRYKGSSKIDELHISDTSIVKPLK